jgi:hypothetical protein
MAWVMRRLGAVALSAATLAACADVLGIRELPLAGDDGGVAVESGVPDALGMVDVTVDGSPTDAGTVDVTVDGNPTDAGTVDVTAESAAVASSGDSGADVARDAAADRAAGCGDCDGGCCNTATSQCVFAGASGSCGTDGGACVDCSGSSRGTVCMAQGICGCIAATDCLPGLVCQATGNICGPGP